MIPENGSNAANNGEGLGSSPSRRYFSIKVLDPREVTSGKNGEENNYDPRFKNRAILRYNDPDLGQRLALISARDSDHLRTLLSIGHRLGDDEAGVAEERLRRVLDSFTEASYGLKPRPKATIWTGEGPSWIGCDEPSCRHHDDGGCSNKTALINDDCEMDQWCMTYEPRDKSESVSGNDSIMNERSEIRDTLIGCLEQVSSDETYQAFFREVAGEVLFRIRNHQLEVRGIGCTDSDFNHENFTNSGSALFLLKIRSSYGHGKKAVVFVHPRFSECLEVAPFSTRVRAIKDLSSVVLNFAGQHIFVEGIGIINRVEELDYVFGHQLADAPSGSVLTEDQVQLAMTHRGKCNLH